MAQEHGSRGGDDDVRIEPLSAGGDAAEASIRALVSAAHRADDVAPLSEESLLRLARAGSGRASDPVAATADLLVRDRGGQAVGYAQADLDPEGRRLSAEVVVHPDHRRRGIGSALVRELEHRAGESVAALRIWAHGNRAPARALAQRLGYQPVRELWQLSRPLAGPDAEALPPVTEARPWPEGLRLRAFRTGQDEAAWLALNARAFAHHPEQGAWTPEDLAAREASDWFDPDGFLLAEADDGSLAGFHWTKQHGEVKGRRLGEVYVMGVDPAWQGHGLGGLLTAAGLAYLAGQGIEDVMLYVDGDNAAARATYERLGFGPAALDVMYARHPEFT